jgi:hypothetical protein
LVHNASDIGVPDKIFTTKLRFATDQRGRIRVEEEKQEWSPHQSSFVPKISIDIFDGIGRKLYFPKNIAGYPAAYLSAESADHVGRESRSTALRLAYRPFNREYGVSNLTKVRLKKMDTPKGNDNLIVLEHRNTTVWVDSKKDFLPVRYTESQRDTVHRVLDLEYQSDEVHGWVVKSWNSTWTEPEGYLSSVSAKVLEYSINSKIDDSEFEPEFPPGTWVQNLSTDETYILRSNGQRRPVLKGEFNGTNYNELLESEPKR